MTSGNSSSGCWRWSPAKTSNRAMRRGRGGSPARWPKERIVSTVDPETRHTHKSRSNYRDGYKAHLAVEPETGIITDVDLTPANAGDGPVGVALLDDETDAVEVFADSAYGSGPVRADLAERGHTAVIKP
jgi:IS5 family transposase